MCSANRTRTTRTSCCSFFALGGAFGLGLLLVVGWVALIAPRPVRAQTMQCFDELDRYTIAWLRKSFLTLSDPDGGEVALASDSYIYLQPSASVRSTSLYVYVDGNLSASIAPADSDGTVYQMPYGVSGDTIRIDLKDNNSRGTAITQICFDGLSPVLDDDEPEPEPGGCINLDPGLESGGSDWDEIGSPEWLTETVILEHEEGIYQVVDLVPGAYTVFVTATYSSDNLQTKPLTVSLGYTETQQRVEMWGVQYVDFAVTEAGAYTLTVVSDFFDLAGEEVVEVGHVCLMRVSCVNDDPYVKANDPYRLNNMYWSDIGTPLYFTRTQGVALDYQDGVAQNILLPAGTYQFVAVLTNTVTDTIPYVWLGADMAGAQIKADPTLTVTWDFAVTNSGTYQINAKNPVNTTPITLTYLCVSPIDIELCTFTDYEMNGSGWDTVGDATFQDGTAVLGCGGYVEQFLYLPKGPHIISITADADFLVSGAGFNPYNEGGDLTISWEGEYHDSGEVNLSIPGGLYDGANTYTATINIPIAGNYRFSMWNRDNCYDDGWWVFSESKTGTIIIDDICLPRNIGEIGINVGDCRFVQDSTMVGWGWNDVDVSWSGTRARLAPGGRISQTINISTTDPITQLVAYVVARSEPGAQLRAALVTSHTWTISQTMSSDFSVFTATLDFTNTTDFTLSSVAGEIEIDFACLYRVGEVPPGSWYPGADGDPVCVRPLDPDMSGGFWEDVAAILRLIWEWVVFLWCEVTLWLSRIWFQLKSWVRETAIDLGEWLTELSIEVANWPVVVFITDLILFIVWLLARFGLLLAGILAPVLWAIEFAFTMIPALINQIADPSPVAALELGELEQGFLFVQSIFNDTPLAALFVLFNAMMWVVFIVWSIRQFSTSNA